MQANIFVAVLLALAVGHVTSAPQKVEENAQDLVKCNSQEGDYELTYVQIKDTGHYAGEVDIDFTYPPEGIPAKNVINCVIIKNLDPDGSGTATITKGQLGDTRMTINLSSSFTKGASFTIQIIGQPMGDVTTSAS